MSQTPEQQSTSPSDAHSAPTGHRESLEGWIPPLATENEIRAALERAFDYRGDVTITLKDGQKIEGYIFDRHSEGEALIDCWVRILPKDGGPAMKITYDRIAALAFTGRDTAAGRSWEMWVTKYTEKKAAGETGIRLEPEKLD